MLGPLFQAVLNGVVSGMVLTLPAMGFSAIFAVLRYPSFAIGALATCGAYGGWFVNTRWGWPIGWALPAAFLAAAAVGVLIERVAVRPLEPLGALMMGVASLVLSFLLENLLRFGFGNDQRGFALPLLRDITFGAWRMGPQQIKNIGLALLVMAGVWAFLRFSNTGRSMRAVADNPDLARLRGSQPARVALITMVLASGLAGVGGMLVGLDTSIDPMTGTRLMLSIFAASVLGGLGSIPGAVLGALAAAAGLAVTFSTLRLRDDYLAIVTLGFAEVLRIVATNERALTGSADGIPGIPSGISRAGGPAFALFWLGLMSAAALCVFILLRRLAASPWGRSVRAVRDDVVVVVAVAGKPVTRIKAQTFALSSAIAGLAGALYGHFGSYVAPDMFQPQITIYIFLAVTLGGNGRPAGALLGTYVLMAFLELTRFGAERIGGISAVQGAALREITVSVVLLALMRLRPDGLLPELNQRAGNLPGPSTSERP